MLIRSVNWASGLALVLPPILGFAPDTQAAGLIATSGANRVQLLELYSSEGCSSCPPADRWVSQLKGKPELWRRFVPVVFHVDYWNSLGWKDGFSSDLMTQRQVDISHLWARPQVYTPAFVLDGKEWRDWRNANSDHFPRPDEASGIKLSIYQEKTGEFKVTGEGHKINQNYILRFAQLGMNISSDVTNGENAGQLLEHNFVVLAWQSRAVHGKQLAETFRLTASGQKATKFAVVAWIEEEGKPLPLQAVGGDL